MQKTSLDTRWMRDEQGDEGADRDKSQPVAFPFMSKDRIIGVPVSHRNHNITYIKKRHANQGFGLKPTIASQLYFIDLLG